MAQFDVYRNLDPASKQRTPFLLDIQNDLFEQLMTRVVVPLHWRTDFTQPLEILNPMLVVNKQKVVMSTAELAGILQQELGEKVGSLKHKRAEVIAALDFLVTGF